MCWKIWRQAFLARPMSFWACTVYYKLLNKLFDRRLSFLPKHLPLLYSHIWRPHIQRFSIFHHVFQGLCTIGFNTLDFRVVLRSCPHTLQGPVSQTYDKKWHPQSCPVPSTASVKASRQCPASGNVKPILDICSCATCEHPNLEPHYSILHFYQAKNTAWRDCWEWQK